MCRGVDISVHTAGGLRCTLIDFTLSRLRTMDGSLAFCDLAIDPELFQGPKANIQVGSWGGVWQLLNVFRSDPHRPSLSTPPMIIFSRRTRIAG